MLTKGDQDEEIAEALQHDSEAAANVGAAKAKAIGHVGNDTTEASLPSAYKTGEKAAATSNVHGLKNDSAKSKATSGVSLVSGGANFQPKKEKAKKELTAEQMERRDLGILKKKYTPAAKEAAALGAQKNHEAAESRTTPQIAGPYAARPASAFGSRTQMTWGTNPKADTPTPFRHSHAPMGSRAPVDRIDSRSMVDDTRQRAMMKPRPTPLFSHKLPEAAQYEGASEWSERNRKAARSLADSHGNRVPAGGWPKMTGTDEARQKQAVREIDSVLRHPEIQVKITQDRRHVPVIKYRAPAKHQEGIAGVVNTGRGAVYSKDGLLHLLSNDREENAILLGKTKWVAGKQANRGVKDASH